MDDPPFSQQKAKVVSVSEIKLSLGKEDFKKWMDLVESFPGYGNLAKGKRKTDEEDDPEVKCESSMEVERDFNNLLKCPICLRKFNSYHFGMSRHIMTHETDGDVEMVYFVHEYTEKLKEKLAKSIKKCKKVANPDIPFKCDLCDKTWDSQKKLTGHHSRVHKPRINRPVTVTEIKRFPCVFCNHQSRSFSDLEIHTRTHTGEMPFECEACHKRVTTVGHLRAHIKWNCEAAKKVGLEPPPFLINRVGTTVNNEESSATPTADSQKHSSLAGKPRKKEKLVKCSMCDEMLSCNYTKLEHEGSHGDNNPCKFCPAKFLYHQGLSKHMRKFHPEKVETFPCNKCDLKFKCLSALVTHKSRVHKQYYVIQTPNGPKTKTHVVKKRLATPEEIFLAPPIKDMKLVVEEVSKEGPSQDPLAPLKTETDPWNEYLLS